jgi:hypothetical protein
MWLMSASSKGMSAMKLAEGLGVAYQTAWRLGHRIRAMMAEDSPVLRGVVELDEMYAGAAPRKRAKRGLYKRGEVTARPKTGEIRCRSSLSGCVRELDRAQRSLPRT